MRCRVFWLKASLVKYSHKQDLCHESQSILLISLDDGLPLFTSSQPVGKTVPILCRPFLWQSRCFTPTPPTSLASTTLQRCFFRPSNIIRSAKSKASKQHCEFDHCSGPWGRLWGAARTWGGTCKAWFAYLACSLDQLNTGPLLQQKLGTLDILWDFAEVDLRRLDELRKVRKLCVAHITHI